MACYRPIPAKQEGSQQPKLWPPMGEANLALPCGKCIGCRSARATAWAHRCAHEASSWQHNTFLTLTYNDENIPEEGHLRPTDLQRFIKRLRKRATKGQTSIRSDRRSNIRYFACGEYGEHTQRPHYHALLFNCGFADTTKVGKDLYESEIVNDLWTRGTNRLGTATPAAAAYIAQYNLKKQGHGDHDADGVWRPPPFLRMSLKPAIGLTWLDQYKHDLIHGYLIEEQHRQTIPRTYINKLKETDQQLAEEINIRKIQYRNNNPTDNNTPERQQAAEIIHTRKKQLTENRTL